MKSKTMILMGIAIVCGLVASYMTSKLLAEREQAPDQVVEIEKVKVLVAKQSIPYGTSLAEPEKFFQEKLFTKGEQPSKAISNPEELKGKYLLHPLGAEQHVTKEDLMDKETGGIQFKLPPGMRAIAVKVNAESLAGGFVLPNSRVDIMCTIRGEEAKIVLQDMLILAIDTNETKADGQRAILGGTATLQADPDQSELLSYAQAVGELRLLPRGINDRAEVKTSGKGKEHVFKGLDANKQDTEDAEEADNGTGGAAGGKAPRGSTKRAQAKKDTQPQDEEVTTFVQTIVNGTEVTKIEFKFDLDGFLIDPQAAAAANQANQDANENRPAPKPALKEKLIKAASKNNPDDQPPAEPKSARFHQAVGQ